MKKSNRILVFLLVILFFGCNDSTVVKSENINELNNFLVSPDSSNLFGNIIITIKSDSFPTAASKTTVYVGEHKMYNISYEKNTIKGYIEGSETAGKKAIVIYMDDDKYLLKNAFTYTDLYYPLFRDMYSLGASYTQGFVSMGLNWKTQLHSPFGQLARQVGAYFPQPLLKENILYESKLRDAKKSCRAIDLLNPDIKNTVDALQLIKNKEGKDVLSFASYRINPDLEPHNIGIGGSTIQDTVNGAQYGRLHSLTIFENIAYNPYVDMGKVFEDPPQGSPFEYAINHSPTIIFSTDLFADDILDFVFATNSPVTSQVTKVEIIREKLVEMFDEFKEKNVTAYIANMPDITIMAIFKFFENSFYKKGFTNETVKEWKKNVQILSAKYSNTFTEVANKYDNVHIVDFRGYLNKMYYSKGSDKEIKVNDAITIKNGGIVVGKEVFTTDFLGGLLSLDAIHLTYTGYALIADMFIDQINKDEGYNIPFIDLSKVAQEDPLTPDKIRDYGINVSACTDEFFTP